MFGKEPENTTVSAGQTSIIAQGCKFEGSIEVRGTLRIEGEFKGNIGVPESLVVGKTGVVRASVKVKNAIIGGQFFGDIEAENKIELQSGSHLEGDIKTKRLVIDEGVFFEGNCSMGAKKTNDTPAHAGPPVPPAAKPQPASPEPVKK
ncbi:MAG: polymer-forming cytoskeletal protein [Candidatus Krumholzibacteria bacterium]|jgi:cytoskeletal protein CcmA (bactofilin family)|nr:polymer-forming cytoskeletal protein [Candidatus Krumholzibacteria bacterium]